jgi:mannose-6-phosphate isomerase-like protein (cupin superfamily)
MMKQVILTCIPVFLMATISCNRPAESAGSSNVQNKTADPVSFFTPDQMDRVLKSELDSLKFKGSTLLAAHILDTSEEGAPYLLVIRTGPGSVEIHEQWDDVAIMRSGHGILKTGYQIDGEKKETSPGNWVGGKIVGGMERSLSPGDFVVIPAKLGHQFIPSPGDSLTYWTIKVRRQKSK